MDARLEFLSQQKRQHLAQGHFLGLLHILIGRRIEKADGALVSNGLTWRELAGLLKKVRWEKETAKELPLDYSALPPRDREKFWYAAIAQAGVGSEKAAAAGDALAEALGKAGYVIGPAPRPQSS
jgi:hypothetical protein